MTLHPLTSKGGAFVLKIGFVFKACSRKLLQAFLCLLDLPGENTVHGVGGLQLCTVVQMCVNVSRG